jgi:hypothetical protein
LTWTGNPTPFAARDADDIGRFDFLKDVQRLESVTAQLSGVDGYAVLLTNARTYWQPPTRQAPADAQFRVHEGVVMCGNRAWGPGAGSGTTKGREGPLVLRGSYAMQWQDYSEVAGIGAGRFRYLVVHVVSPGPAGARRTT